MLLLAAKRYWVIASARIPRQDRLLISVFSCRLAQPLLRMEANHPHINHQWDGNNLLMSWRTCVLRRSWSSDREAFANGNLAHLPEIPHEINDANNIFCRSSNGVGWRDGSSLTKPEIMAMIQAHEHSLQILPM